MQDTQVVKRVEITPLEVASEDNIRQELNLIDPDTITVGDEISPEMDKLAGQFVTQVVSFNPNDPKQLASRSDHVASVEALGAKALEAASHRSDMLKEPIRKLAKKGEDGGEVANALVDLKNHVEALDPSEMDFSAGWLSRALGFLPGVGSPLKKYFTQFESAQTVIDAVLNSLIKGKDMLLRDNKTLANDQDSLRMVSFLLTNQIKLGKLIDEKLEYSLERDIPEDDPRIRFIKDELLFPLRQRIIGLQKRLSVTQQGIMSIEFIIRTNKELIRGVNLAKDTTLAALDVAVIVAMALANQKIVLDKIAALNTTTDNLLASTAKKLKTQGVEIQKQAAEGGLKIETLQAAFQDINSAMSEISKFRQEALPQMANSILTMDQLTQEAEKSIQKMEKGNRVAPSLELELAPAINDK